jgi:hypothetical protein
MPQPLDLENWTIDEHKSIQDSKVADDSEKWDCYSEFSSHLCPKTSEQFPSFLHPACVLEMSVFFIY